MNARVTHYSRTTDHNGIEMRLIGDWIDLAAYYEGSDGNAWCYSASTRRWANCGDIETFRAHFAARFRGQLFF